METTLLHHMHVNLREYGEYMVVMYVCDVQESVDQGTSTRPGPGRGPTAGYYRQRVGATVAGGPSSVYSPPPVEQQVPEAWPRRGPWTGSGGNGGPTMGIRSIETYADYTIIETVEVIKRPGQSLGFYIREGNGVDRTNGVFISRIAPGSMVERNGLLRVGEEIVAVDSVDITRMSLDDVVILMSIPRRLVLTVRTRKSCCSKNLSCPALLTPTSTSALQPPLLPLQPVVPQRADEAVREGTALREGTTVTTARPREHQRHWSTASVVDLADNYADADYDQVARSTLRRQAGDSSRVAEPASAARQQTARSTGVRTEPWPPAPGYFDHQAPLADSQQRSLYSVGLGPVALPPSSRVTEPPVVSRSWDRRAPAPAAGEMVSAGARRPARAYHHLDYSSDTDAQFVDDQLPVQWRRPPPSHRPPIEVVSREVQPLFEPEWPPTINAKRRRAPAGAAPPRVDHHAVEIAADLHPGKRFNSDSELNGFDKLFGDDTLTASELVRPGDRCNSLPDIDNGVTGGAGDELRHWLRKLDKLSSELQEFNNRPPTSGITVTDSGVFKGGHGATPPL